jgi:hypothetical protein
MKNESAGHGALHRNAASAAVMRRFPRLEAVEREFRDLPQILAR